MVEVANQVIEISDDDEMNRDPTKLIQFQDEIDSHFAMRKQVHGRALSEGKTAEQA